MNQRRAKRPHGELRQSQVVTTFGPGSMLDLPQHSVLVAGLDHWTGVSDEIVEPRLADKICTLLDIPAVKLYAPPPDPQDPRRHNPGLLPGSFQSGLSFRNPPAVKHRPFDHVCL